VAASRVSGERRGAGIRPAPRTLSLALMALCTGLAGCRPASVTTRRERSVYVNVAALRDLHPAWAVVQVPELASLPGPDAGAPELTEALRLPPRIVDIAPLPETAPERQAVGPSLRRDPLASLQAALVARDVRTLGRETKAIRRQVESDFAARRLSLEAQRRSSETESDARAAKATRDRELEEIGIRSRIAISTGDVRAKQEADLARLQRITRAAIRDREIARTALRSRAAQEVADLRTEIEETVAHRLEQREAELAAATRTEVEDYRAGIRKMLETAKPAARDLRRAGPPLTAPRPVSPRDVLGRSGVAWRAVAPPPASATIARQNAVLTRVIDADIERLVRVAVRRRGWTVRFTPAPNCEDVTQTMRDALRKEPGEY
jgi:hypothetical protein